MLLTTLQSITIKRWMEFKGDNGSELALRERIKELTCLYNVVRIAEETDVSLSLDHLLQNIVETVPPAWQYPDITCARITFDNKHYTTADFTETQYKQSSEIVISDKQRGVIEVIYREERPEIAEGPFLEEERKLINAIAHEISGIIERRQAREDKSKLEEQLRHADRLATIGQLAAGVAHELNEPLGNILGFAQLMEKMEELPKKAKEDLSKIVNACLHARSVISKLRLFARQTPFKKTETNINMLIGEELLFIESRCSKQGIGIVEDLDPGLPEISVDPSQLYQVLINLLVNAIQAMPKGGVLTIRTRQREGGIYLSIEDTGVGMSKEVQSKIFMPFFTTKDVDEGTGLGLSVVHGIVNSYGGAISVKSEPGKGSIFEITLPVEERVGKGREES